mgnify:CR=1 FL=1
MRWRAAGDGEKNEDGGSEWGVEEDRVRGRFICTSMRVGARCAGRMHTEEETEQTKAAWHKGRMGCGIWERMGMGVQFKEEITAGRWQKRTAGRS